MKSVQKSAESLRYQRRLFSPNSDSSWVLHTNMSVEYPRVYTLIYRNTISWRTQVSIPRRNRRCSLVLLTKDFLLSFHVNSLDMFNAVSELRVSLVFGGGDLSLLFLNIYLMLF